jgi:hypothetical protein
METSPPSTGSGKRGRSDETIAFVAGLLRAFNRLLGIASFQGARVDLPHSMDKWDCDWRAVKIIVL